MYNVRNENMQTQAHILCDVRTAASERLQTKRRLKAFAANAHANGVKRITNVIYTNEQLGKQQIKMAVRVYSTEKFNLILVFWFPSINTYSGFS